MKHVGERRGICWVMAGKPEGKKPLERHRRRDLDNIKMDIREMYCRLLLIYTRCD